MVKAVVEDRGNCRMGQAGTQASFLGKRCPHATVHGRRCARCLAGGEDHFQGDMTVKPLVATEKHDPHAAAAKLVDQAISLLKHGAWLEVVDDSLEASGSRPSVARSPLPPSRATM